jgi:signal transduction histidine kinase
MKGIGWVELGSSQRRPKGFPQLFAPGARYTLRRTALAAVALVAFVTAIAATSAAIEGHADAGVEIDSSGRVAAVSPTGFAWRDGIRPGQLVLATTKSDAAEGWELVTQGAEGPILSREAPVVEALRNSLLFALVALAAGCLAIAFLRTNREWALPASCLALAGSSVPLLLANHGLAGTVQILAAAVPATWALLRVRRRVWLAVAMAIGSMVVLAGWYQAFVSGAPAGDLEQARRVIALGGMGLLMAERAMQNRPNRPVRIVSLQMLWAVAAATVIAFGLVLVYFAAFPAPVVAIAIVLSLLALPAIRRAIGRRIELALMADLREHVAADIAEEERGRLARELHDAPLQELSALIRRLELVPGARAETRSLQDIANQLRSVAIDLRPPMLDDLGLAAALDFLAEQVTSVDTVVVATLSDTTQIDPSSRPPAAVEFALYRISREAVTNALQHAEAHNIAITGRIARDSIDLVVSDDGVGVDDQASRRSSGRGHFGMASMRRRAKAIGAELAIEGTRAGTRVAMAWRA